MHIAIIETGEPPSPLNEKHPSYGAMMETMLSPIAPHFTYSRWRVFDGGDQPQIGAFDGLLITGSPAGVYEGHEWITPLEELIRATAAARKPQTGICFGHQIMAQAFGGDVKKSDKGWGVGVHQYQVSQPTPWTGAPIGRVECVVSHQDQVINAPETASVIASSDFCPNAMLVYEHAPAFSMQPHPEFSHDFAHGLLSLRRTRVGEALADEGLASLKGRTDRALLAHWIANFFNMHRP